MHVTIVIPVYNGKDHLQRAVDSALDQTGNIDFEIIIVDNISTDGSEILGQQIADQHDIVSFYKTDQQGSAYPRNLGLDKAKGKWIQFLDVDDTIHPDKLEKQVKLGNAADIDIVISPFTEKTISQKNVHSIISTDNPWLALINGQLGITTSNLWRKTKLVEIGGWDINQKSHQDYLLLYSLLQSEARLAYLDEEIMTKYEQAKSISLSDSFPYDGVVLRRKIEQYLNGNNLITPAIESALHNYYYDKTLWAYKLDASKGKELLSMIDIKPDLAIKPWYHSIGLKVFGLEKWFDLIS